MSFEEDSSAGSAASLAEEHEDIREDIEEVWGTTSGEVGSATSGEVGSATPGRWGAAVSSVYGPDEVNDEVFEELCLGDAMAAEVQSTWSLFLRGVGSREAAGEAVYAALFEAAPSLQSLFKTPRAVMAMRFMAGLSSIISTLQDPRALKVVVETLGFQHLDLEVTAPRVAVFRDAIVDLLQGEMGDALTMQASTGWCTFLNYVGGAFIYVRIKYAERLKCIASSWAKASGKATIGNGEEDEGGEGGVEEEVAQKAKEPSKGKSWFGSGKKTSAGASSADGKTESGFKNAMVPKTFEEMFVFNAAVMGFGSRIWMQDILASFDSIVSNVSNCYRLQEECDVLALRMAKFRGDINLGEYKSAMLASLRSLVKDWASLHEVSWSWLWENVERMLKKMLGKPAKQEASLSALVGSLDEASLMTVRREVYSKFFALAPSGQDYFKQSTTRLHFIADKLLVTTLDMYREPRRMVEDLSALGLRHVGYGVPTDMFGPFVTACVQVVRMLTDDDEAEESFRWSLSLISRILSRVINEGSTIVMKAINANSGKQLAKAIACAPRGKRALWMLNVQVGTQSISPLMWAIETGSLEAARAIIVDLLTIRADRDRYYYGMDIMFERHADIIQRLCVDAPGLLPVLLDGLIWRSRLTEGGMRRVNYYIKHLVVDAEGGFAPAIELIAAFGDPKLVCHPVLSMITDMVWERVAFRTFLTGKLWFIFTLIVFVLSQSILHHLQPHGSDGPASERVAIAACRAFNYVCSMGQMLFRHSREAVHDIRRRDYVQVGCISVPASWSQWQDLVGVTLTLLLILMLCLEPLLHCLADSTAELLVRHCEAGDTSLFAYSVTSSLAMLMYFLLLCDLSVLSNRLSAYALVCFCVVSEVALFLFGLTFFVLAFACAVCSLEHGSYDFSGIPKSALQLFKITFGMFSGSRYDMLMDYPVLVVAVFIYVVTTVIFLLNLLVAQLSCAFQAIYQDMLGLARLNRGKIVAETMVSVPRPRWRRFVEGLRLDERVEFGEGDVGLAGGVQVWEPASANVTTVDMIRRFGGSTSSSAQWPEEGRGSEEDRFERMERLVEKAVKRMSGGKRRGSRSADSQSGAESSMMESSCSDASMAESG